MRNGNQQFIPLLLCRNEKVLTVPMRNGNYNSKYTIHDEHYVLTVPMRNGNITVSTEVLTAAICSYRTYEEWKHGF